MLKGADLDVLRVPADADDVRDRDPDGVRHIGRVPLRAERARFLRRYEVNVVGC